MERKATKDEAAPKSRAERETELRKMLDGGGCVLVGEKWFGPEATEEERRRYAQELDRRPTAGASDGARVAQGPREAARGPAGVGANPPDGANRHSGDRGRRPAARGLLHGVRSGAESVRIPVPRRENAPGTCRRRGNCRLDVRPARASASRRATAGRRRNGRREKVGTTVVRAPEALRALDACESPHSDGRARGMGVRTGISCEHASPWRDAP